MKRREFHAAVAALLGAGLAPATARAAQATRYGALSLIGRQVTVVTHEPDVGSHIVDHNDKDTYKLDEDLFDDEALRVLQTTIEQAASSKPLLYRSKDPALFEEPSVLFDDDKVRLPDGLLTAMESDGAERLFLLTRHRQATELRAKHNRVGSGKIEGIGYYLDRTKKMRRSDTGEVGIGFIAPFVCLRLSLVDLASRRLLGDELIDGTRTISVAHAKDSFNPWDALTQQQQVDTLLRMLDRQLAIAVPKVLGRAQGAGAGPAPQSTDFS